MCRRQWGAIKGRLPPAIATAAEFMQWTIDAHNEINENVGRPKFVPGAISQRNLH